MNLRNEFLISEYQIKSTGCYSNCNVWRSRSLGPGKHRSSEALKPGRIPASETRLTQERRAVSSPVITSLSEGPVGAAQQQAKWLRVQVKERIGGSPAPPAAHLRLALNKVT